MSVILVANGATVSKDPDASKVYAIDWDLNSLAPGVTIASFTFAISALAPSLVDAVLTKDSDAKLTAAQATTALQRTVTGDNRVTLVRLLGGTIGQLYEIEHSITTSESPSQTKICTFRVLIEG